MAPNSGEAGLSKDGQRLNLLAPSDGEAQMIKSLISHCRAGWSLPREFYSGQAVYLADLDRLWRSGWLFAGHSCEIPKPGDFFTVEIDADSILVIRGDDGAIRGMHNVCRHRG